MRILVTGGTGFVGCNLAMYFMEQGHEVSITGFDNEQKIKVNGKKIFKDLSEIKWEEFGRVDAIFHEAANNLTTSTDVKEMMRTNVDASMKLFKYAKDSGCKKIVYASSTAVYGSMNEPFKENMECKPLNPYGESKLELDKRAMVFANKNKDISVIGLRYCNIYGPHEDHKGTRSSMIYQLAQQMKKENPKIFKHGEQSRDFVYIKDVVKANILALNTKGSFIVNCGSGKATSFNEVISILNSVIKLKRKTEYFDNPHKGKYQDFTQCDLSLAKKKLNYSPDFNIKKGIKDYFESGFLVK